MTIQPIQSLSFSMLANRGVFALLLGSGISRSAKIPTADEITVRMVEWLWKIENNDAKDDIPNSENLMKWYEKPMEKVQTIPSYLIN